MAEAEILSPVERVELVRAELRKGAGILRWKLDVKCKKDRGAEERVT